MSLRRRYDCGNLMNWSSNSTDSRASLGMTVHFEAVKVHNLRAI